MNPTQEEAEKLAKFLGVETFDDDNIGVGNLVVSNNRRVYLTSWLQSDSGTVAMELELIKKLGYIVVDLEETKELGIFYNIQTGNVCADGDTLNAALINTCLEVIENGEEIK